MTQATVLTLMPILAVVLTPRDIYAAEDVYLPHP